MATEPTSETRKAEVDTAAVRAEFPPSASPTDPYFVIHRLAAALDEARAERDARGVASDAFAKAAAERGTRAEKAEAELASWIKVLCESTDRIDHLVYQRDTERAAGDYWEERALKAEAELTAARAAIARVEALDLEVHCGCGESYILTGDLRAALTPPAAGERCGFKHDGETPCENPKGGCWQAGDPAPAAGDGEEPKMSCKAHMDGDCDYPLCPQLADNEPAETGRHCPWDRPDYLDESRAPAVGDGVSLADGPFTGKRHQQPETPSYASIVDPALREAIKVTLRSRLVCAGTFDTNTEGLADALMPVITAAVTEATAALRAERDAIQAHDRKWVAEAERQRAGLHSEKVRADKAEAVLAEYQEDLRRWHARAEAAEARATEATTCPCAPFVEQLATAWEEGRDAVYVESTDAEIVLCAGANPYGAAGADPT